MNRLGASFQGSPAVQLVAARLAAVLSACRPTVAAAAPPACLADTHWAVSVAGCAVEQLRIETQRVRHHALRELGGRPAGAGALRGWYWPGDGRIHLMHCEVGTGIVVRAFTGRVSRDAQGRLCMRGTIALDVTGGGPAERPFRARLSDARPADGAQAARCGPSSRACAASR